MKGTTKRTLLMAALALTLGLGAGKTYADTAKSAKVENVTIDAKKNVTIFWSDGTSNLYTGDEKVYVMEDSQPCCDTPGQLVYAIKLKLNDTTYKSVIETRKATGNHVWGDTKTEITKKATCTEEGEVRYVQYCTTCKGSVKAEREVAARVKTQKTSHDWKVSYEYSPEYNTRGDDEGNAYLIDNNEAGYYYIVNTCSKCGTVSKKKVDLSAEEGRQHLTAPVVTPVDAKGNPDGENINVEVINGKPYLKDCGKDGYWRYQYYDVDGKLIRVDSVQKINAGTHRAAAPIVENPSKNLNVINDGTNGKDIVVENLSCAEEASYDAVVYCLNEKCAKHQSKKNPISRDKKTLKPSENHTPAAEKVVENDTATCQKAGTKDLVLYCAICKKELGRETVNSPKKETCKKKDPVAENEIAATDHYRGSYESVVYCEYGVEHGRTTIYVAPKNPDKFKWAYEIKWNHEVAQSDNERGKDDSDSYYKDDEFIGADEARSIAKLVAVAQDDDIKAHGDQDLFTTEMTLKVTEDESKRVDGDECHLGERTYTATAKGKYSVEVYDYEARNFDAYIIEKSTAKDAEKLDLSSTKTYRFAGKNYKGHSWGKWKLNEEGTAYVRTCKICGDTEENWIDGKEKETEAPKKSIKGAVIEGRITYRGEYSPIPYTVTLDGKKLKVNRDFEFTNTQGNEFKVAGPHKVTIKGIGEYEGEAKGKLYIDPAKQKIKVSLSKKTFKASALKKKAASFQITVTNNKGKVTYSLKKNNKKIEISKKGKVTLKKGLKAGKYQITVKAAATKNYKAATKTVTFTVK